MAARQPQFEEIVETLNNAISALSSEGLEDFAKDTQNLVGRIKGMGSIIPSHKNGLYSIIRMMLETNTYYDSKATQDLERTYTLINEALDGNV